MINGHKIYIIAATDRNFGIGKNGLLPWDFKNDLKHFANITKATKDPNKQHLLVMGRATWDSIPEAFRPFRKRKNAVLDFNPNYELEGATVHGSIEDALEKAGDDVEDIFFIGGGSIYRQAMEHPLVDGVYLTHIDHEYDCDTFFPQVHERFGNKELLGHDHEDDIKLEYYLYSKQKQEK